MECSVHQYRRDILHDAVDTPAWSTSFTFISPLKASSQLHTLQTYVEALTGKIDSHQMAEVCEEHSVSHKLIWPKGQTQSRPCAIKSSCSTTSYSPLAQEKWQSLTYIHEFFFTYFGQVTTVSSPISAITWNSCDRSPPVNPVAAFTNKEVNTMTRK